MSTERERETDRQRERENISDTWPYEPIYGQPIQTCFEACLQELLAK